MNCTATLHESEKLLRLELSASPAVWSEIADDNVSIMAISDGLGVLSCAGATSAGRVSGTSSDYRLVTLARAIKSCEGRGGGVLS